MKTSIRRAAFRCLAFAAAAATATAAFTPSVVAADLPIKSRPDVVVQHSWSGFYVGAHGGWGWGSSYLEDPFFTHPISMPVEYKSNGPIVGGQIGANWQYGNVVVGVEADGSWASMRSASVTNPVPGQFGNGIEINALATATGRVGYTMGYWLVYAKAGGAWANMKFVTNSLGSQVVTYNENRFGATAGAGMEVAFLRNVSAKVEYNFLYFPEHSLVFMHPDSVSRFDHYVHLVKAGINVRFGGDHVVARY
jgi:outer membrane immunogenic protein